MDNLQQVYETARAAWQPDASDNPDNYWFYSGWAGFKAVCDVLNVDINRWNGIFHNSFFMNHGEWDKVLANLKHYAANAKIPEKPERPYYGDYSKPSFRPERAKAIFDSQFKAKYPDKRLNSKFARSEWVRLESKAMEFAKAEFERDLADWQVGEDRRQAEYSKRVAEWQKSVDAINECKAFVARLTGETMPCGCPWTESGVHVIGCGEVM